MQALTLNYVNQPFRCAIRTTHYQYDDYQEYELLNIDVFYSARGNPDFGYDGNGLDFGDGNYDYFEEEGFVGFTFIAKNGERFPARRLSKLHRYSMDDTEDHIRLSYGKGIVSNSFRTEVWCNSNRQFRFRGVEYGYIPRRKISTNRGKGLR